MVIAAIIIGAGIITELCMVLLAPLGYQDDKGFHPGDESVEHADGTVGANSR